MAAGLSHSAVSTAIQRESDNMTTDAIRKLASTAHVSVAWLAFGIGEPDDLEVPTPKFAPPALIEALTELTAEDVFVSPGALQRAGDERDETRTKTEWIAFLLRHTLEDIHSDPSVYQLVIRERGAKYRARKGDPKPPEEDKRPAAAASDVADRRKSRRSG